jgi:LPXTG-motif cell wall-anchored protein
MRISIIALAILALPTLTIQASAQTKPTPSTGIFKGAPGPIVGAGLPALAIGFGVYWLVKRRRKDKQV